MYQAIYFSRVGWLELINIIVKIDSMALELELLSVYNSFVGLKSVVGVGKIINCTDFIYYWIFGWSWSFEDAYSSLRWSGRSFCMSAPIGQGSWLARHCRRSCVVWNIVPYNAKTHMFLICKVFVFLYWLSFGQEHPNSLAGRLIAIWQIL